MDLDRSLAFSPSEHESLFQNLDHRPAVFALFLAPRSAPSVDSPPYLAYTKDLRRRLIRLLGRSAHKSRAMTLGDVARRIEFQYVGSSFEARWFLYGLNRHYYPRLYRRRLRLRPPALLKINLANRFPRCYPTHRLLNDGSAYYGPFPSRNAAERFAGEFLDLFKIRRCVEELHPDPSHPGCIYSQMNMCLAPCYGGCTDDAYASEVSRVAEFLNAAGRPLVRLLEEERDHASEALDFESAQKAHRKIEKVDEILRLRPEMARNLRELHAVLVLPGAEANTVTFYRTIAGELKGPVTLLLDENVSAPVPLDEQIQALLSSLLSSCQTPGRLPHWEHLSLLARWYYSSFREGEAVMLPPSQQLPHARLIRLCRKIVSARG